MVPHDVNRARSHLIPVRRPRIINQNIYLIELGQRKVDQCAPCINLRDVCVLEDHVRGILGSDFLASFGVDIGDDDLCAFLSEAAGDCSAESGTTTC